MSEFFLVRYECYSILREISSSSSLCSSLLVSACVKLPTNQPTNQPNKTNNNKQQQQKTTQTHTKANKQTNLQIREKKAAINYINYQDSKLVQRKTVLSNRSPSWTSKTLLLFANKRPIFHKYRARHLQRFLWEPGI